MFSPYHADGVTDEASKGNVENEANTRIVPQQLHGFIGFYSISPPDKVVVATRQNRGLVRAVATDMAGGLCEGFNQCQSTYEAVLGKHDVYVVAPCIGSDSGQAERQYKD